MVYSIYLPFFGAFAEKASQNYLSAPRRPGAERRVGEAWRFNGGKAVRLQRRGAETV